MSARSKNDKGIVVGGEPRIDFLPPEIKRKKQARRTFRGLIALVVLVIAVCVVAYGGVTTVSIAKQIALAEEQQRTLDLLKKQQEYSAARQAADDIALTTEARLFGSAREILWKPYLNELELRLPAGEQVTRVAVASQNALELTPEPPTPLVSSSIASLEIVGTAGSFGDIATFVENLETMPGFAGAWVTQIELSEDGGSFTFVLTLSVDEAALAKRFYVEEEPPAVPEEEASAAEGEEQS